MHGASLPGLVTEAVVLPPVRKACPATRLPTRVTAPIVPGSGRTGVHVSVPVIPHTP